MIDPEIIKGWLMVALLIGGLGSMVIIYSYTEIREWKKK